MRIIARGVRNITRDDIIEFFKEFDETLGLDYRATWSETDGVLFDVYFDMNDIAIAPVLDGIKIYRKDYPYGPSYYMDADDFIKIEVV